MNTTTNKNFLADFGIEIKNNPKISDRLNSFLTYYYGCNPTKTYQLDIPNNDSYRNLFNVLIENMFEKHTKTKEVYYGNVFSHNIPEKIMLHNLELYEELASFKSTKLLELTIFYIDYKPFEDANVMFGLNALTQQNMFIDLMTKNNKKNIILTCGTGRLHQNINYLKI